MGRFGERTSRGIAAIALVGGFVASSAAVLAGGISEAGAIPAVSPCPAPVISGTTATVTCSYNGTTGADGSAQNWTVPAGVTQATFNLYGAQGGGSSGGPGGQAEGTFTVTPGSTLQVNVGGQPSGAAAGYNGGGGASTLGSATGGGGSSDVRDGAFGLADRIAVAGGGGGAGDQASPMATTFMGGGGGGANGGALDPLDCSEIFSACGGGGTSSTGGSAGTTTACVGGLPLTGSVLTDTAATSGGTGVGGNGGSLSCGSETALPAATITSVYGAGGGGGWFGGGGGASLIAAGDVLGVAGGPGGGGSGYLDPSATNPTMNTGVQSGNGEVVITYTVAAQSPPTTRVLIPSNGKTVSGTAATLDASASNATGVLFVLFGGTYGYHGQVLCTATLTYYGWVCSWNSKTIPNGAYTLTAFAYNSGAYAFSAGVDIAVEN